MGAYDERAVVLAYVDAQRPPYPHEDFRRFRQERLRALEAAYGIRVSLEGARVALEGAKTWGGLALWMLFNATANTYLGLKDPREAFLEASLIESKIDSLGAAGQEIRAVEERLSAHLKGCREAHIDLLTRLFVQIWGPVAHPLGPEDLLAYSFDESAEPKLSNYYDDM